MLQKIINISLVIILTFATIGFSISQHYCGNRLISVTVNDTAESCCGPVGNCCQNEVIHLQIEDDFVVTGSCQIDPIQNVTILSLSKASIVFVNNSVDFNSSELCSTSSPPFDLPEYLATIQSYLI